MHVLNWNDQFVFPTLIFVFSFSEFFNRVTVGLLISYSNRNKNQCFKKN